ncbi:class I glutamine amidotransferase-like protein [Lasiosphaeria miniovina]|uniref:Class I glutamine amidotransferase-like protein n=1 Tax=Lasiosphaeria miniovina TaxID=1954250 RepID=A0AA40ACX1_9PEZI|nr:class I glutamine amidotransferase-like protein [Lasiosphaeria miniovina]KAK0713546.1 class I glutamine amidotransferase-like protein [Lasiosphaeria miniovina]
MVQVLIMMADYGHDPTETAVPYHAFKNAGFHVNFATETGNTPACDKRMLEGLTQKVLGAKRSTVTLYTAMTQTLEWTLPRSWTAAAFTLAPFDLVFLPGGHDKAVRQLIDSACARRLLADFFPGTRKPSARAAAAVCHGVLALAGACDAATGRSVLADCATTALPARFEQLAFWGTRLFLGDYYKTYGVGSEDVEPSVRKALADPKQYKNSLSPLPFVVEDTQFNYISARFPGDVELMASRIVDLMHNIDQTPSIPGV